jgi:uncharacterized protein YabN with tetrapyrrole methylase and pyrophosphatase domain
LQNLKNNKELPMDATVKKTLHSLQEAEDLGFVWPELKTLLLAVQSEISEIEDALTKQEGPARLEEEVGDLLLGCLEICRYLSISPAQSLDVAEKKFTQRLKKVKENLLRDGKTDLRSATFDQRLTRWKEAKTQTSELAKKVDTIPIRKLGTSHR